MTREVVAHTLGTRVHRVGALFPIRGADLAVVLGDELEGAERAQGFLEYEVLELGLPRRRRLPEFD